MKKKAPVFITISVLIVSILLVSIQYFLPSALAPQILLTLHDADGVKSVSLGETAEYVILVENVGETAGHILLSKEGTAFGWISSLSHTTLHIHPGDSKTISLFISPTSAQAEPVVKVNVIATRGENVTIVGTTTYLQGTVLIKEPLDTEWKPYEQGTDIGEGDSLKTEANSYGQFDFGEHLRIILLPESQILCKFSYELDGAMIYDFHLRNGEASFSMELPGSGSQFSLNSSNGDRAIVNSSDKTVFLVRSSGLLRVFVGEVSYFSSQTRQFNEFTETIISPGWDSTGKTFNYVILDYPNDIVTGILKNVKGDSIGFDNSGNFVAAGDIDGFVFRTESRDTFYVYGLDIESLSFDLSVIKSGMYDLLYFRYDPELQGFAFKDMETPSKDTVLFQFKIDQVYLRSPSEIHYDLEIRSKVTDRFYLNEMTIYTDEGNTYKVLNYVHLSNPEVNSVLFGRDTDGDGVVDEDVRIHTGMSGKDVYEELEEEEEPSAIITAVIALVIIIIILTMYFILLMGGKGEIPEPPEDIMGIETYERKEPEPEGKLPEEAMEKELPAEPEESDKHGFPPEPEEPHGEGISYGSEATKEEETSTESEEPTKEGISYGSERPTDKMSLVVPPDAQISEQPSSVAEELIEMKKLTILDEEYEPILEEASAEEPGPPLEVSKEIPDEEISPDFPPEGIPEEGYEQIPLFESEGYKKISDEELSPELSSQEVPEEHGPPPNNIEKGYLKIQEIRDRLDSVWSASDDEWWEGWEQDLEEQINSLKKKVEKEISQ